MPYESQSANDLKHINFLRKALRENSRISISFSGAAGWKGTLALENGNFDAEQGMLALIRRIFETDVVGFEWEPLTQPLEGSVEASLSLARALNNWHPDAERIRIYRYNFSKLPPVRLKAAMLFRMLPDDRPLYSQLYQESLRAEGVRLAEFLGESEPGVLLKKIRIVLVCYCLGTLIPIEPPKPMEPVVRENKMEVARRILTKLRSN